MRKLIYFLIFSLPIVMASCKKESDSGPSKNGTALQLMLDSVFLYEKQVYYWNDALPEYKTFQPRNYTGNTDLAALNKELFALSQYKINPATGKAFEYDPSDPGSPKYSFIDDGSVEKQLNGVTGDFGFAPLWIDLNDLRIRYVAPNSPAALAGIKRGYQIMSINGRTDLTYDGDGGSGTNVNFVINAYANSTTITMVLKKPDQTTTNVSLNAATYTINPVYAHTVITQDSHKVGYINFSAFTSLDNSRARLLEAFNDFAAKGINDLVVDLRYNGGGYTLTSEYFADLIAPAAANGQLMYNSYFNSLMTSNKATLLKNQVRRDEESGDLYTYADEDFSKERQARYFDKSGLPTLTGLNRVFFLVSGATASASELLINNLRPYLDVKLIGTTTFGKPVGFMEIDINKYQMYSPMFETKNSHNEGGYFNGMKPGSSTYPGYEDYDDVEHDFGDPSEALLAHALSYIKTGTFSITGPRIQSTASKQRTMSVEQTRQAAMQLAKGTFSNMVLNGRSHK